MPEETEPTPTTPAPDETAPPDRTEDTAPARSGVAVPKWLAVGVVALALAGGGFAIGRATASDHHGGMVPIGNIRPGGGPGGRGGFGGPGGPGGPGGRFGGDRHGPGPGGDSNNNGNGGSNGSTTPSTTPGTGSTGA
jgi:hypothetical protein